MEGAKRGVGVGFRVSGLQAQENTFKWQWQQRQGDRGPVSALIRRKFGTNADSPRDFMVAELHQ